MAQNDILEGYITREELAKQFAISTRTLARWEDLRTGPPVTRIGIKLLYRIETVRNWLIAREQKVVRPMRRKGQ